MKNHYWIVTKPNWEWTDIVGVFKPRDKAKEWIERQDYPKHYNITRITLNEPVVREDEHL